MQIQRVQNNNNYSTNFCAKNTFLKKSNYFRNLHNEAKARLSYQKFLKAETEWLDAFETSKLDAVKAFAKMAYRKLQSFYYLNL